MMVDHLAFDELRIAMRATASLDKFAVAHGLHWPTHVSPARSTLATIASAVLECDQPNVHIHLNSTAKGPWITTNMARRIEASTSALSKKHDEQIPDGTSRMASKSFALRNPVESTIYVDPFGPNTVPALSPQQTMLADPSGTATEDARLTRAMHRPSQSTVRGSRRSAQRIGSLHLMATTRECMGSSPGRHNPCAPMAEDHSSSCQSEHPGQTQATLRNTILDSQQPHRLVVLDKSDISPRLLRSLLCAFRNSVSELRTCQSNG